MQMLAKVFDDMFQLLVGHCSAPLQPGASRRCFEANSGCPQWAEGTPAKQMAHPSESALPGPDAGQVARSCSMQNRNCQTKGGKTPGAPKGNRHCAPLACNRCMFRL